jgi:hypothetical protein
MYGAVLAYNAAMAELAAARGHQQPTLADEYRASYVEWVEQRIEPRLAELRDWDRGELWRLVSTMLHGRYGRTRDFSERWMVAVIAHPKEAFDDPATRSLIAGRERDMKGQLARLHNPHSLERWNGRSGVYELRYRWDQARTVLEDIAAGLRAGGKAD